jgi:hypothetical protein
LTRSSLHRCLERHGISWLPEVEADKPRKKKSSEQRRDPAVAVTAMLAANVTMAWVSVSSPSRCVGPVTLRAAWLHHQTARMTSFGTMSQIFRPMGFSPGKAVRAVLSEMSAT